MMTEQEHSTTRRQLFNRIRQEYGRDGNPNSNEFVQMTQVCLLRIFNLPPDALSKHTEKEVKKTSEEFAYALKQKWNLKKVDRHMDRLEKHHKDFLDHMIKFTQKPDEEEEDEPEEGDQPEEDEIQVNPFHSTATGEPKPKRSRVDHNTPFNEKVIFWYILRTNFGH